MPSAVDVLSDPYLLLGHKWTLFDVDTIARALEVPPQVRWRHVLVHCAREEQSGSGDTIMPTRLLRDADNKEKYKGISQHISKDVQADVFGDMMRDGDGGVTRMPWGLSFALEESLCNEQDVFTLASWPPCLEDARDKAWDVLNTTYTRMRLSAEQKDAVIQAFGPHHMSLVTGNHGCGKSACCDAIAHVARTLGLGYHFMAYTWLAAYRIGEACKGVTATSIHNFVYTRMGQAKRVGGIDLAVVDEASLVGTSVLAKLLRVLPRHCKLVLVGDDAQLPPIAYGQPFADLVAACRSNNPRNTAPLAQLTKVFRTDKPHIIGFSDACRAGQVPRWIKKAGGCVSTSDFVWHGNLEEKAILQELTRLLLCQGEDIQILAAGKKGVVGVPALNALAATILRPATTSHQQFRHKDLVMHTAGAGKAIRDVPVGTRGTVLYGEVVRWENGQRTPLRAGTAECMAHMFVAGDKVMFWATAKENNDVRNGHRGRVTRVCDDGSVIVAYGAQGDVRHDRDELDHLQLAYAITVHKYQGNEAPHVFVVVHSSHGWPLHTRNMLYTAVTRGKSKAVNKSSIVNDVLTDVLMSSSQQCTAESSAKQVMSFKNISSVGCKVNFTNIDQAAEFTTNFTCSQASSNAADLSSQFAARLNQEVESKVKGFGGALVSSAESENISDLQSKITNNIDISSVAACVATNVSDQLLEFGEVKVNCTGLTGSDAELDFNNISQRLIANHTPQCLMQQDTAAKAAADLDAVIDSKAKASNEGFDLAGMLNNIVTSIFGTWTAALGMVGAICLAIICCCCCFSALPMLMGGGGGAKLRAPHYSMAIGRQAAA
ncbi:hypothetical protein OEZ85_011028 [Tetradesmus obliquus]|uniref:UvrD-like helicase C-terminal domain-containing protein n=1 Tax=Tetradesmus obliquus TaxID=3088 RepID=A0ABY8TR72_TETOB|nr:hypothetical protein OEZ85_011028 [Tetradesmus obliquus]